MAGAILGPGETLLPDQSIQSFKGRFRLVMQGDGNLVLLALQRDDVTWLPVWATGTDNHDGAECLMSSSGELLVGYPGSPALWSSGTAGHPSSYLVLQDDGNLVIYYPQDPIWATGTNGPPKPPAPPAGPNKGQYLAAGHALAPGEQLVSPNQRYRFILQTDGNLVLYDVDNSTWSSGTADKTVGECIMQTDANLVVYGPDGVVWASGTNGRAAKAFLRIQDDGNAVIYGEIAIWALH